MNSLSDNAGINAELKKVCTQCLKEKSLTDFHAHKNLPGGRKSYCKECHKNKYKNYRSPSETKRKEEYQNQKQELITQLQSATHKECTKCKQLLPKEKFKPRKNYSLDGLNQQCCDCVNARNEQLRRSKGVKPKKPEYAKLGILESFIGNIEEAEALSLSGIYYLGGVCSKGHDWHNTGYSLRFKSNTHCLSCSKEHTSRHQKENRDMYRYYRWLKTPRISPSVAELVAKSEQVARTYYKELFMSPEERAEYNRKNREAYKKRYYDNVESERLRVRIYKNANPQKVASWGDKRLKRIASQSDGTLTKTATKQLLANAKKCPYCSEPITQSTATIDHLIPVSMGGLHSIHNVVACCAQCNFKKGAKPFAEWANSLDEKHKAKAEYIYKKKHGAPPTQHTLQLKFL